MPPVPERGSRRSGARRIALVITGCALAAACAAPPPAGPAVAVRLPAGDCRPGDDCAFDFGAVDAEGSSVRAFDIVNTGDDDTEVTNVGLVGDPSFRIGSAVEDQLHAGGSIPFAIEVSPRTASTITADLRITSGVGVVDVLFSATGIARGVELTPHVCSFRDVPVGATSEPCTLTFENSGDATSVIDDLRLGPAVFQPTAALVLPLSIAPGERVDVDVVARPEERGRVSGAVSFLKDSIEVSGAAVLDVNGI